ncbi:glycosyltransferase family 2 protein [Salegentibacter sp. F14]
MKPLISIIIPTYNRADLLGETLASVLKQTYQNWECIIVDDGSEDDTKALVHSYKDNRIKYFYKKHEERSQARNLGLSKANGDLIQFLDSDDILENTKLKRSLEKISIESPEFKNIVITNFRNFYDSSEKTICPYCKLKNEYLNFNSILFEWEFKFSIPIHCALIDKRLIIDFKFPSQLSQKEDWFLWLHIFQDPKLKINFIDKPLVLQRLVKTKARLNDYEIEKKVLAHLQNRISDNERADYYLYLIEDKNKKIFQLRNSVGNYRNTRTYKLSQMVKKILKLG